ncbi:MAG: protein kinase [Myxococcaceae bacterium]|nr:protein kinase [Myxococcaceae bacterium]
MAPSPSPTSACPDEGALVDFVREHRGDPALESHLADCAVCAAVVAELLQGPDEREPTLRSDRYQVLGFLGAGSSGRVFLVRDQLLGRKLALKVQRWTEAGGDERRDALLREAQALATVSHPNVVQVYDCFDSGDGLVIAMEYVEGESLRTMLRGQRERHVLLAAMVQAGRGLAAIHAKGLLHGDFKPENVLVGADGRVRLGDFGLAALIAQDGFRGHTPAYAAPEVVAGVTASAAADQYAFCVALAECASGSRTSDHRHVPARLRRVLERGLHPSPAERYPSLEALLADLERPWWKPRSARRAWAAAVTAGLLLATLGGLTFARAERCRRASSRVAQAWPRARADAVHQAFASVAVGEGEFAFSQLDAAATGLGARWSEARTAICGAEGEPLGSAVADCLEEERAMFESLVSGYLTPDLATVLDAPRVALSLPDPLACQRDVERKARPPSAAVGLLGELRAARETSHYAQALERLPAAVERARADGRLDLEGRLALLEGQLRIETHAYAAAQAPLLRAAELGQKMANEPASATAMTWLARLARLEGRRDEAAHWLQLAGGLGDRVGPEVALGLDAERAQLLSAQGQFDDALALQDQVIGRSQTTFGPSSPHALEQVRGRGRILFGAGRYQAHVDEAQGLLEQYRRVFGPHHLYVGKLLELRASALGELRRLDEASDDLEQATAIFRANGGDGSPLMVLAQGARAGLLERQERYEEARVLGQSAEAGARAAFGKGHPQTVWLTGEHARVLARSGHVGEAVTKLSALLAETADTPQLASYRVDLALDQVVLGRPRDALETLAVLPADGGAMRPELEAKLLATELAAELALGAPTIGPRLERLVALTTADTAPPERCFRQLVLSRALSDRAESRARGKALRTVAQETCRQLTRPGPDIALARRLAGID